MQIQVNKNKKSKDGENIAKNTLASVSASVCSYTALSAIGTFLNNEVLAQINTVFTTFAPIMIGISLFYILYSNDIVMFPKLSAIYETSEITPCSPFVVQEGVKFNKFYGLKKIHKRKPLIINPNDEEF